MKRVYFTLTLMSLFGGLNAFADVKQDGVVYDKMPDGKCFVVGYDEATMPENGIVTIANTINIDGTDYTVTGILGSEDYTAYNNGKTGDDRAAFFNCKKIIGLRFADGSDVTLIGDHAFKSCTNLKTIENIPSTLQDIQKWCFEGTALESVDLSQTKLQYLPNGCFYNCRQLKEVKLPSTLTTPNSGTWVEADDAKYGKQAFSETAIESIDLTNTQLISLGDYMFADCQKLMTVKLPSTLKYIWNHAFCNSSLSSITFPRSLQKIDAWAFQNTQLTNVVIPTQCSSIEQGAFIDNANLTTVVINGLKCYLAYQAFCNCSKLTDVYITSKEAPVVERYGFPFNKDLKVHVMKDFVDIFYGLKTSETYNPCNATSFDSNLSLTLGKEWTTFTSAYNLDFSNVEGGLTAYTAKYNKANDAVALTPVKKVAAHTGLILKGEANTTYTLPILASNEAGLEAVTDNQLVDCVDAVWSSSHDKDYFLYNGKFVNSKNAGWALPGKSFLYIEGGRANQSESPLRVYVDNTATAINGITNNSVVKDEAYYNLQGVKVQRPQHGVFIHNGKKVVLK
ncbi:leucine-rich repeat domain-containing protein [Leyella stercorea]|uniref:leucine-rich repeat domain-containing protein n=1 Tax=Leyella stercorea TaxID=363265 RepID=UPI003A9518AD